IYQNLKSASDKSTQVYIPDLPCNILCDIEENIIEDRKPKLPEKILLDTIASKLYPDASFIDDYSSFSTEIIEMTHKKFDGTEVKYGKTVYTDKNIVTNSLIMLNRFGQKISDDLPKAFKLRLHDFFTQIDMSIVLNTGKEGDLNMKETEENFAFMKDNLELGDIFKKDNWEFILARDIPVNIEELSKNIKSDKPSWYDFSIKLHHSHVNTKQKSESQGMPYGLKTIDKEKNLIIYCCDKEPVTNSKGEQSYIVRYQPNVIWVLTVTFDPDTMRKNIENSLRLPDIEYNNDIIFFRKEPSFPTHPRPFLLVNKIIPIMAYETNMDSTANLKQASRTALQQLVEAVKEAMKNPDVGSSNDSKNLFSISFDPSQQASPAT
ncbi:6981_t:CDS:2, partial [Scutellospora calospora]